MVELLLSCATLLKAGLMSINDYNDLLDKLFLETPDDSLLLDLEFVSSDINGTISCLLNYCLKRLVDYDGFGRYLIDGLKKAYSDCGLDIKGYAAKVYALWETLPSSIDLKEPFWTMSYADDPLSYGDEQQTRALYEKMFRFYEENQ